MLTDNWDRWLAAHRSDFVDIIGEVSESHPAMLADHLVTQICIAIRQGDERAINLALALLNEDPRMPFGRTLKSQIARAFKSVAGSLNPYQRHQIVRYRDKLLALDHPPRETMEFDRVVRKFDNVL